MKIHELLTDPSKWIQGYYTKDVNGDFVNFDNERATQWCLVGAVMKCYGSLEVDSPSAVRLAVFEKLYTRLKKPIVSWNDDSTRTFDDVQQLVVELDI